MEVLTQEQVDQYARVGAIVVPDRVGTQTLDLIRAEIAGFEAEARDMTTSNERIDLEDSHTQANPRIRRVKRPDRISAVFRDVMLSDAILAPVRDLIGPDLRLHTTKLNMKSAGYGAAVEWHQDWAFYPHTNDDVLAVGLMIDDMELQNGPLMVFPGTHTGQVFDHHQDGHFVGAMDLQRAQLQPDKALALTGKAGSISIHHARIVHGSSLNRSDRSRRIAFFEMMAADAFPVFGSMGDPEDVNEFNDRLLCGNATLEPRLEPVPVRIPYPQKGDRGSIYTIQKGLKKRSFETHGQEDVMSS